MDVWQKKQKWLVITMTSLFKTRICKDAAGLHSFSFSKSASADVSVRDIDRRSVLYIDRLVQSIMQPKQ